jgi:AcrR family transcriptional regulator
METKSTKARIMDTAEKLFADKGFHATSLRDITKSADVNLAAVHYHFGSKEDLLDAVLGRRIAPVNTQRLNMLKEVEASADGNNPDLKAVLRAYLLPPFRNMSILGKDGAKFMQLLGRMHSETQSHLRLRFMRHFTPVLESFTVAFARSLPELPVDEVRWRMQFVIGAMAHTLIWGEQLRTHGMDAESMFEKLIDFCEAGMQAPAERLHMVEVGA